MFWGMALEIDVLTSGDRLMGTTIIDLMGEEHLSHMPFHVQTHTHTSLLHALFHKFQAYTLNFVHMQRLYIYIYLYLYLIYFFNLY
jgi:hypothetical protein